MVVMRISSSVFVPVAAAGASGVGASVALAPFAVVGSSSKPTVSHREPWMQLL